MQIIRVNWICGACVLSFKFLSYAQEEIKYLYYIDFQFILRILRKS